VIAGGNGAARALVCSVGRPVTIDDFSAGLCEGNGTAKE
jgi:hypothetical protein